MSTPTGPDHVDIDRDRVLDDELEIDPVDDDELPEQLDRDIEAPEPDVLDQLRDVPLDDEH